MSGLLATYEWGQLPGRKLEVAVFKLQKRIYSGSHTDHIQNPTCLKKPLASLGERVCKA